MNDYLTIQKFAKTTGVEVSKLHYWEKIGLFEPAMRNPENGYRYYSLAQVIALNFITTLSELGVPLKIIGQLREKRDPDRFLKLLENNLKRMDQELRLLHQRYSIIHARQELIRYGNSVDDTEITVSKRADLSMILWPRNKYKEGDTFVEPLTSFVNQANGHNINLCFPVGGYHENMESFLNKSGTPEHFFSIDPNGSHTRKAGKYLIGFTRGYYADMGDLPERMAAYAKKNSLNLTGPVYTIYLHDEICVQDPSQYLAQSCVAVAGR